MAVGLAVGPGEAVAGDVNAGAARDWQAARRTGIRPDIRICLMGNDALRMLILPPKVHERSLTYPDVGGSEVSLRGTPWRLRTPIDIFIKGFFDEGA